MALFGAPVATETDAVRCVRAGLELQRVLARSRRPAPAGCASGSASPPARRWSTWPRPATAGRRSSPATWSTPPSRLQSVAPAGRGAGLRHHARGRPGPRSATPSRPPVTLRGRSAADRGLAGPGPGAAAADRPGADADPDGRPRPRAGAADQRAAPRRSRDRTPRLVTVLRPGRHRQEPAGPRAVPARRATWSTSRSPGAAGAARRSARTSPTPRWPTSSRPQAGVLDTDTRDDRRASGSTPRCETWSAAGESARLSDALRPLVGCPARRCPTEDAESAWRRFLLALAARGPTVLVFEDLHWADDRDDALRRAARRDRPRRAAAACVCTARPELRRPGPDAGPARSPACCPSR